jgi:hypothetical protein
MNQPNDGLGYATFTSNPGWPDGSNPNYDAYAAAPGVYGMGSNMSVHSGVLTIIGSAAALLVVVGVLFRK